MSRLLSITRKRIFIALAVFLTAGVLLTLGVGYYLTSPAERSGQDQVVVIREGWTLKEVSGELEKRRIITSKTLFRLWARAAGYNRNIKAGEYVLSPGISPIGILKKLAKGEVISHMVTIPEGYGTQQIGEILERRGLVGKRQFLSMACDPGIIKRYGLSVKSLEGYLFPDTYLFTRGISPLSMMDTMVRRFFRVMDPLKGRVEETGMPLEEVITLASMVEKETALSAERPLIASVFLNRLRKGMRLDSDPTVIYGLKEFDGNLRREDLQKATPYNTYMIQGLPPGPIASPGLESIRAVLYPAQGEYLYFVSRNDGSHHFSKTLAEHNRAVRLYQKKGPHGDGGPMKQSSSQSTP